MAFEVKFHEILKVWVIADNNLRELLVHPDGHVLQFDSKEAAEKVAFQEDRAPSHARMELNGWDIPKSNGNE